MQGFPAVAASTRIARITAHCTIDTFTSRAQACSTEKRADDEPACVCIEKIRTCRGPVFLPDLPDDPPGYPRTSRDDDYLPEV